METPEDAQKLLDMMRNVSSEPMRLGLLVALDKSPKHCMFSFVQGHGLEILDKWLRQSAEARYACLLVLQKLPVTLADLQKADAKLMKFPPGWWFLPGWWFRILIFNRTWGLSK